MVVIPEKKQALQIEGGICRSHVIIRKKGTDRLGLGLYAGAESARDYRFKQGSKQSKFSAITGLLIKLNPCFTVFLCYLSAALPALPALLKYISVTTITQTLHLSYTILLTLNTFYKHIVSSSILVSS